MSTDVIWVGICFASFLVGGLTFAWWDGVNGAVMLARYKKEIEKENNESI